MTTVIATQNLSRCFGAITAVDSLTFEVNQGEVIGFLGHNGAGKTTTVRLLNGLLTPTRGSVKVLGLDPIKDGPALRLQTGILTETPSLDEQLTASESLTFYGRLYNLDRIVIEQRSNRLLNAFGLMDRADDRLATYSKGMRQRVALARALLHNPELLFLDEPTNGLDPVAARQVHQTIAQLSQGGAHTIFLCTHNLNEAQLLCDKIAVLEHGRLIAFGQPGELAENLVKGVKVEFEFDLRNSGATLHNIQALIGVHSEVISHQTLAILLPSRQDIPDIVNFLSSKGARIMRVNPHEPTLEDVYFALHGDHTPDEQGNEEAK